MRQQESSGVSELANPGELPPQGAIGVMSFEFAASSPPVLANAASTDARSRFFGTVNGSAS
jgi:hypothetical protein